MTFLKKLIKMEFTDWENFTLDDMNLLTNSSRKELNCYLEFYNKTKINSTEKYCNYTWDGASCWPMTAAQSLAVIPCLSELRGVYYDVTQNATRMCEANGSWAEKADYSGCQPILPETEQYPDLLDVKHTSTIYYIGYSLSLIALIIALSIFLYFKDLRCSRNTIHTNLMITYILNDLTWIITATLQSSSSPVAAKIACLLIIMLTYLMGTNFFWMFVEGLYLYILVVKTFSVDMVKFSVYLGIGWGLPAVIIIIWVIVKSLCSSVENSSLVKQRCFWQNSDSYDYIYIGPVIIVLVINIYFLAKIMWVLITKLRAATSVESQQYRKASKALLVLIPLLGITYVILITTPSHRMARILFAYFQATLLSTQGFTVAVLYCFLNGEVRNSLRHYMTRRQIQKTIGSVARPSLNSQQTETLRLYPRRVIRDQDSLATTDSWISNTREKNTNEHRPSNGCYNLCNVKDDII